MTALQIATIGVVTAIVGSVFGVWYLLIEDHKDRRPKAHFRLKWSIALLALAVDAISVFALREAYKSDGEVTALKAKLDDFQGGRLTSAQQAIISRRLKGFPSKEPIAFKRPREYQPGAMTGFDLYVQLCYSGWDWVCAGDDDVPTPSNDTTVFLLARRASPALVEINVTLREAKIPCKVVVDSRFVREEILFLIGSPPEGEPIFENEKRE